MSEPKFNPDIMNDRICPLPNEPHMDVCTNCGSYFAWTKGHDERCRRAQMPTNTQRCLRCIPVSTE